MRDIALNTGVGIQVRGLGSGRLEVERVDGTMVEAPTRFMLILSAGCKLANNFRDATLQVITHLRGVARKYDHFCGTHFLPLPAQRGHEGMYGFGEWSLSCERFLMDVLSEFPAPHLMAPFHGAHLGGKDKGRRWGKGAFYFGWGKGKKPDDDYDDYDDADREYPPWLAPRGWFAH